MKLSATCLLLVTLHHWNSCSAATPQPTFQADGVPFKAPVKIAPRFSSRVLFSNLTSPRGITLDAEENILVVERGFGVTAFSPVDGGWERAVVISNPNFTQGIQVDGELLYVSTASDVLVYTYDAVLKSVKSNVPFPIITGLPPDGGRSHSIIFPGSVHIRFRVNYAYSPTKTEWREHDDAGRQRALDQY
jgi:hypothetical protein